MDILQCNVVAHLFECFRTIPAEQVRTCRIYVCLQLLDGRGGVARDY